MSFRYKPYEGEAPYVFISYCHKDKELCEQLLNMLCEKNIRVWYDNAIHVGDEWPEMIANHLKKSRVCILLITEGFAASDNCNRELAFSFKHGIPALPVLVDDTIISAGMDLIIGVTKYIRISKTERSALRELLRSPDVLACEGNEVTGFVTEEGDSTEIAPPKKPSKASLLDRKRKTITVSENGFYFETKEEGLSVFTEKRDNAIVSIEKRENEWNLKCIQSPVYFADSACEKNKARKLIEATEEFELKEQRFVFIHSEKAAEIINDGKVGMLECDSTGEMKILDKKTLLGRDNTWLKGTMDDPYISRTHAEIRLDNGEFYLIDNSENGSIINSKTLLNNEKSKLKNGDTIQLGETVLRLTCLPVNKETSGEEKRK